MTFPSSQLHTGLYVCFCNKAEFLGYTQDQHRAQHITSTYEVFAAQVSLEVEASIRLVPMSSLQVLFACAEALHAHGYSNEASRLTVELAQDLLANPPDLKVEPPPAKVRETSNPLLPTYP